MTLGQANAANELPAWCEQHLKDDRLDEVIAMYRMSIRRLIGKRIYDRFQKNIISSVAEAVAALRRHGIGDGGSHVDLAARHALTTMERRSGPAGPFKVLSDERTALDELLRVHEEQLRSERLAALLLTEAIVNPREPVTRGRSSGMEICANG